MLVRHGKVIDRMLKRELITQAELASAARRQGIDDLADIECARLEVGGALTFRLKKPSGEDRWRQEIVQRLEHIEQLLTSRA